MADKPDRTKAALDDRLNELETLIDDGGTARAVIPVLDELVDPGVDETFDAEAEDYPSMDEEDIEDLAGRIEQKLSAELDEIVNILKGNLKESILNELHDRVKKGPGDKS